MIDVSEHIGLINTTIDRIAGPQADDELFGEAQLALVRAAESYDPAISAWSTFATHVVITTCLDYFRTTMRRECRMSNNHDEVFDRMTFRDDEPADDRLDFDREYLLRLVRAASGRLSQQERIVIAGVLDGREPGDIGRADGMGAAAARAAYRSATKTLAAMVGRIDE